MTIGAIFVQLCSLKIFCPRLEVCMCAAINSTVAGLQNLILDDYSAISDPDLSL